MLSQSRKRACPSPLRGNFTSFFWDAHADLVKDMMSRDQSFSSNGSFYDDTFSEGEEDQRYCNVKDQRGSLVTAGDSGVASNCSSSAASDHSSPIYSQIRSITKGLGLRRSQSSSTISNGHIERPERRYIQKERRSVRRGESSFVRAPQRNTYASASFHHSRIATAQPTEGRYSVKKRKIYEEINFGTRVDAQKAKPCCWECFEARVERERVSAGLPARTAYLPEPPVENHYENISFDAHDSCCLSVTRIADRSLPIPRGVAPAAVPAIPPRKSRREMDQEEEEMSESDTYARLCSIEFSKLRAAESIFSEERLASLQRKIQQLLLVESNINLSSKSLSEPEFAKAANQVVYLIERRLRAIEAYSKPQFKKITAELISLLASADKKQKSKIDSFKRGFARAVKVIF